MGDIYKISRKVLKDHGIDIKRGSSFTLDLGNDIVINAVIKNINADEVMAEAL